MALNTARHKAIAESYMPDTAALYRPDYAGTGGPTLIGSYPCRVVTAVVGGANALDPTGEATHLLHLPAGTAVRAGDELVVNGALRHLALADNDGRSYGYDTVVATRREA
jgi:hypothetical protein